MKKPDQTNINTMSLYDESREAWDKLAGSGFPTLAAMAKQFHRCVDMAKALGVSDQSVSNWKRGIRATPQMERKAQEWAWGQQRAEAPKQPDLPLFEQAATEAPKPPHEVILLVRCAKDTLPGLQSVFSALRCTVETIA